MTIAAHWTPEHRAKNDQEYGCLAPDPDVYEAPIETWATKLERCMGTAGLDAVKQDACKQETLTNTIHVLFWNLSERRRRTIAKCATEAAP